MPDARVEFIFHQCLGKGGFGEVYLATIKRPGGLQKRVAVKVLKEGLSHEEEAVQRLRDEGRMLATLNHPCILRADDLFRVDKRIALVTEYVEGIDLSRATKADRLLPPRVVVSVLGEVADALDSAWNAPSPETGRPLQLIHRDIKPENIRLTPHGQVKLLDFGIARTTEMFRHAQTRVGDLPFTPGYAAPESLRRGDQGPASDVYALGVTMFRLLAGTRLFEGMDIGAQFGVAVHEEDYAPFLAERLEKLEGVDARIRGLVTRMLAWDPKARPSARDVHVLCEELAEDLDGPTPAKWARGTQFPPPKDVKGASLTGRTLKEDPLGQTESSEAPSDIEEQPIHLEPIGPKGKELLKGVGVAKGPRSSSTTSVPGEKPAPVPGGNPSRPGSITSNPNGPRTPIQPMRPGSLQSLPGAGIPLVPPGATTSGPDRKSSLPGTTTLPPPPPAFTGMPALPQGLKTVAPMTATSPRTSTPAPAPSRGTGSGAPPRGTGTGAPPRGTTTLPPPKGTTTLPPPPPKGTNTLPPPPPKGTSSIDRTPPATRQPSSSSSMERPPATRQPSSSALSSSSSSSLDRTPSSRPTPKSLERQPTRPERAVPPPDPSPLPVSPSLAEIPGPAADRDLPPPKSAPSSGPGVVGYLAAFVIGGGLMLLFVAVLVGAWWGLH